MTESPNPKPGSPSPDSPSGSRQHRDTVLLSDVPEPSAFIADTFVPHASLPNLSSVSLAACDSATTSSLKPDTAAWAMFTKRATVKPARPWP